MSQSRDSRGVSLHGAHSSDDSDNSDNPDNPLSPLNSPPRASSSPPSSLASSVDKYEECEEDTNEAVLDSITYSLYSYAAMVAPVTAAMVLSSLATIYINTPSYSKTASSSFASVYQVYSTDDSDDSGNAELMAKGLVNALVIVCGIGAMTFVMVGLYYFKCIKVLGSFIFLSSFLLLSVYTMTLWTVANDKYLLNVDIITFFYVIANFAFLGVTSIFYSNRKIVPASFAQIYAVLTSVLLAWQLSHFEAWTGWTLLVMLGFYDLCAVLTPCGPLKALVGLLQKDEENNEGRGMIPGLLYEAKLPVKRGTKREGEELKRDGADHDENGDDNDQPPPPASPPKGPLPVPLALALTLRLKVIDEAEVGGPPPYTPEQRLKLIKCVRPNDMLFSRNDGSYKTDGSEGDGVERYFVKFLTTGNVGTYIIDEVGVVFTEELEDNYEDDEDDDGSIKLGLGDFIFYSVLVSKAATYSFTTCVVCIIVILAGLGGTMVLLSVYKQALPALPISIFFGVTFYLLTRFSIEPYIEQVLVNPYYV
ncbi:hypothetical protein TrVE_jg11823 [Triparma verrucosa]|uniref:Presenilin n=1 Tax=Triparma verrucosa TaxID=1606542 RepID=A0A9W7B8H2_9STRA|nr:hypothetical protein TrVE_jg11823 [Triparma verrucosa]